MNVLVLFLFPFLRTLENNGDFGRIVENVGVGFFEIHFPLKSCA